MQLIRQGVVEISITDLFFCNLILDILGNHLLSPFILLNGENKVSKNYHREGWCEIFYKNGTLTKKGIQ